jgi:hypothetical protein
LKRNIDRIILKMDQLFSKKFDLIYFIGLLLLTIKKLKEFGKSLLKDGHHSSGNNNYNHHGNYNGNQPYYGPPGQQQYHGQQQYYSNPGQQYYGPPGQQSYGQQQYFGPSNYNHYGSSSAGGHGGNLHGPMAIFKSFDKDGDGEMSLNNFKNFI